MQAPPYIHIQIHIYFRFKGKLHKSENCSWWKFISIVCFHLAAGQPGSHATGLSVFWLTFQCQNSFRFMVNGMANGFFLR